MPLIRTHVRTASTEDLEAANRTECERCRTSNIEPKPFLPAEQEIAELEAAAAFNGETFRHWARHPDERVPLALLTQHGHQVFPFTATCIALAARVDSEKETLWSSLIDHLVEHGVLRSAWKRLARIAK